MRPNWNIAILLGYAIFIALVSLRPASGISIGSWDKLFHFLAYCLFAILAYRTPTTRQQYVWLCIAIVVYSGLLEVAQFFSPGRFMSGYDLVANALGVGAGALLTGFALKARENT